MNIKHFTKLESTSSTAKELAKHGAEPWTVVWADEQNAGYGKEGRGWYSPKGGLYFSVILPKSNIDDLQTITILAAFIVAKTIKDNFPLEPFVKLPNDIWLFHGAKKGDFSKLDTKEISSCFSQGGVPRKVCGILTENVIGSDIKLSVIGIGVNTNIEKFSPQLENAATSIKIETGQEADNEKILKQIVDGLREQLKTISQ